MPNLLAAFTLHTLLATAPAAEVSPVPADAHAPAAAAEDAVSPDTSDDDALDAVPTTPPDQASTAASTAAAGEIPSSIPSAEPADAAGPAAPAVVSAADPQHVRRLDAVPMVTGLTALAALISAVGAPFLGDAAMLMAVVPALAAGTTMYLATDDGWPSLATALLSGIGAGFGIVLGGAVAAEINKNAPSSQVIGSGLGASLTTTFVAVSVGAAVGAGGMALAGSLTNALVE